MEANVVSEVILPLAIFIIMVTLGMTLTVADFRRVLSEPKQIGVGLLCQIMLLPLVGFIIVYLFPLEPIFALSIILLAASPGGTTSNLIVHAAEADRALSVSLTAISSSLVWLTLPFLMDIAFRTVGDSTQSITFPIGEVMIQVAGLTLVPVIVGMLIRRYRPEFCERVKNGSKIFSGLFLLLIIIVLVIQNWDTILTDGPRFALAFIVLNIAALLIGYGLSKLVGINKLQSITIAIEMGLQNSTIAITVALSIFGSGDMAIIPGLYGMWMLLTGFAFAFWMTHNRTEPSAVAG
ncbi:bile acid:sodium symporter family protein [Candidatus Leptofilum sp.]|uniref:bile acid:sodium symporter family protein n=1 Tax=Candidatus Leptofilum sp. TaxID=3241576 RepID=UPI003B5BE53C